MPPKIEAAKVATFDTDDKRAQYARLVVFNWGVQEKIISKDKDVNTVSQSDMQKAFKSLTGGTLLNGKDGVDLISKLSKKGATDPKVAERGLTTAYAQEVRPFILRGTLSGSFGRRGRKASEEKPATKAATKTKAAPKPSTKRRPAKASGRRSQAKKSEPTPEVEPEAEETPAA